MPYPLPHVRLSDGHGLFKEPNVEWLLVVVLGVEGAG